MLQIRGATLDGRNPANQLIGSLSHYLQGFIHVRWCRISSINSSYLNIYTRFFFRRIPPLLAIFLSHIFFEKRWVNFGSSWLSFIGLFGGKCALSQSIVQRSQGWGCVSKHVGPPRFHVGRVITFELSDFGSPANWHPRGTRCHFWATAMKQPENNIPLY